MGESSVGDNQGGGMKDFAQLLNFVQAPPPQTEHGLDTEGAGKSTTAGAITSQDESTIAQAKKPEDHLSVEGSTDHAEPENPAMVPPDHMVGEIAPGDVPQAQGNAFMNCIYAVALEMVMAEILRTDIYKSMVGSETFLKYKEMEGDMAQNIAQMQINQGLTEFYTSMAKAACCAAAAGMSLTTAGVAAVTRPQMKANMTLNAIIQSGQHMGGSDSVASNMATGFGAVQRTQIEAQITLAQFVQKFFQDMEDRMTSDQKKTDDAIGQIMQMYMQWVNAMFQFTSKG